MEQVVNVSIGAKIDGFVKSFQEAARAIDNSMGGIGQATQAAMADVERHSKRGSDSMREFEREAGSASTGIGSSLKGLSSLLGPLLAGFSLQKATATILDFADAAESLDNTAKIVGTTATNISRLHAVITPMGIDTNVLDGGMKKLAKTMSEAARGGEEQAKALEAVGISAEELKSLSIEQVLAKISDKFKDSEDGATKSALAMALLGRSGADLVPFLNLGSEAMREQGDAAIEMGAAMSGDAVDAGLALDGAWDKLVMQGTGLKNLFAQSLAPALQFIAEAFTDSSGTAMDFGTVFKGIATIVMAVTTVIQDAWNKVSTIVRAITISLASIVDAIGKAATMDFAGAKAALQAGNAMITEELTGMLNKSQQIGGKFKTRMQEMWSGAKPSGGAASPAAEGPKGGIEFEGKGDGGSGNAAAAAKKQAAEAAAAKREQFAYEMELLRNELAAVQKGSEEKLAIMKQMMDKTRDMYGENSREYARAVRDEAKVIEEVENEKLRIKDMALAKGREQAMFEVARTKANGEYLLATGQINSQQKLAIEQQAEEQLYQMQLSYLQSRLQLMALEPAEVERINQQIFALQNEHQLQMQDNQLQSFTTSKEMWDGYFQVINDSFANSIQGMVFQGTTLREAMGSILQNILGSVIQTGVKMVTNWATTQLGMTGATVTGAAVRTAAEVASAKTSSAANAGAGIKNIITKAAEVFANVYSAIAGIPYVGPFLAPVMAVAAGAVVLGMVGKVASAEGGWDRVPYDGAQAILHKEEMVLPGPLAEGLRSLVENGGQRGGVTIQALDRRDVQRYFDDNADSLMRSLSSQAGNNPGGW